MRILESALLCALALWLASSCLSPPVIQPGFGIDANKAISLYPPRTEEVLVRTPRGTSLRGFFVPGTPGAPIVLHLLESGGSAASVALPRHQVFWDLANLGLSSLVLDYSGVGLSDGQAHTGNLSAGAHLMWQEAVRRAGGPDKVIVRCESLGSIAFALLLASEQRPRAALVVNPVTADGVVRRFARSHHGWLAGIFAPLAFRPVARVDVIDELMAFNGPLIVVASPEDELLSAKERSRLQERHAFAELFGEHMVASFQARMLHVDEVRFLLEHAPVATAEIEVMQLVRAAIPAEFREDLDARRLKDTARALRLEPVPTIAAAALCAGDAVDAFRMARIARLGRRPLGFQECRALFSLDDPAGNLDLEAIEVSAIFYSWLASTNARLRDGPKPENWLVENIRQLEPGVKLTMNWTYRSSQISGEMNLSLSLDQGSDVPDRDKRRRIARSHLKALGIGDRVIDQEDGGVGLEFFAGTWVAFPLDSGHP